MASIASSNLEDPWPGTKIMIAGVVFQLISMTVFAGLTVDFTLRSARMGRPAEFTGVLAALYISFITVYIRSIFRTIELCEGWSGYLMLHEGYFIGLDGTLMVIAVGIFVLLDPTRMLPEKRPVLHKEYSPA